MSCISPIPRSAIRSNCSKRNWASRCSAESVDPWCLPMPAKDLRAPSGNSAAIGGWRCPAGSLPEAEWGHPLHHHVVRARLSCLQRMAQLRAELPDVDLWLDTSERKVDFKNRRSRYSDHPGRGRCRAWRHRFAHLTEDQRVPLASPGSDRARLAALPPERLAIAGWPLLHDEGQVTWREWFRGSAVRTRIRSVALIFPTTP